MILSIPPESVKTNLVFCPLVIVIVLEVLQTITDIKLENNEIREINHNSEEKIKIEKNNDIEIV